MSKILGKAKSVAGDVLTGAAAGALVGAVKSGVEQVQDAVGSEGANIATGDSDGGKGGGKK